jgi:general secretion pathway protein H
MPLRTNIDDGFTLLELIVVMVVLGLLLGLVVSNGAMRSPRLAQEAAARAIAQALRESGARAIAEDRTIRFNLNPATGIWREGAYHGVIPPGTVVRFHGLAGTAAGVITFSPDGSASGGRISLSGAGVSAGAEQVITVDWLTGRISVNDAPRPR